MVRDLKKISSGARAQKRANKNIGPNESTNGAQEAPKLAGEGHASPRCFVIMPSGRHNEFGQGEVEADFVYNYIVRPAVDRALGPDACDREIDSLQPGAITAKIIQSIKDYDIAIVDITGGNPNVFFELGVRHSLRKQITIIMKQNNTVIPFDIGNYRLLEYNPFKFENAVDNLSAIISDSLSKNKYPNDSPVIDALGNYDIVYRSESEAERMPWEYYFNAIDTIADLLKKARSREGAGINYAPDAILGITNGGMIFADYLHRLQIYNSDECKYLSLWANRSHAGKYFDCKANEFLLKGIIEDSGKHPEDVVILLVDDNVSGGDTNQLAREFIAKASGVTQIRFLPLSFGRLDIFRKIQENILWTHKAFGLSEEKILELHYVRYRQFPYKKYVSGH